MDLSQYSLPELRQMQTDAAILIKQREKEQITELQDKIAALIDESGLSRVEVLTPLLTRPRKARAPSSVRYQNPANKGQVWLGRGKRPQWLQDLLAQGHSPESLQVAD